MIMQQLRRVALAALCLALTAAGQTVSVWTQHNSNTRIGNNNAETKLTPANVNKNTFGKLFTYTLDDQSYSQPLYIPQLTMAVDGKIHNVVFVTTVNNSVYAFDADSNAVNSGQPLWKVNLTPAGATVPSRAYYSNLGACGHNYNDFAGNLGMVGTPVIDTTSKTLYVVSHVLQGAGKTNVQQLHALDITSGKERSPAPITISATYQGTKFDPQLNNQRPGLALVNGTVYIGWSSYCDFQYTSTYHGWVIGYRASDLTQVAAWNTTGPNGGSQGGLWQSGQAVMADAPNNLYIQTGNGTWIRNTDYGMSTVKLTSALGVASFFTPCNYQYLNSTDLDLGSSGAIPIPGTTYIAGGGKEGVLYLLNSGSLGGNNCPDAIPQEFQAVVPSPATATMHIHGSPVYFKTQSSDEYVYLWGENDFLRVYEFLRSPSAHFDSTAIAASIVRAPQILDSSTAVSGGMSGGFLSISSNGASNGIVWALAVYGCNANQHVEPGILYAFNASQFQAVQATGVLLELWDSKQNVSRDDVGYYAKFTYPTIANGKVYAASWGVVPASQVFQCAPNTVPSNQGQLVVYGLLQ